MKFCPKCGNPEIDDSITECSACGASFSAPTSSQNNPDQTPDRPMKWYKFLIYFALIASAVLNIIAAIGDIRVLTLVGGIYKVIILIEIIVLIASSALAIVTRQKLAGFKQDAPQFVTYVYLVNAIWTIVSTILLVVLLNARINILNVAINLVISIAMISANKTYFDNRRHMFNK